MTPRIDVALVPVVSMALSAGPRVDVVGAVTPVTAISQRVEPPIQIHAGFS